MRITCNHPQSKNGLPVILSDCREVMGYGEGLTAVLIVLGLTREQFAVKYGYNGERSVERLFHKGSRPPVRLLNRLGVALDQLNEAMDWPVTPLGVTTPKGEEVKRRYLERVMKLEVEGLTTSDAQAVVDAEDMS